MLVLYETPAGYALFKLQDGKLSSSDPDAIAKSFQSASSAVKSVSLQSFHKFTDTVDALSAATSLVEGKLSKNLRKFLEDTLSEKDRKKQALMVADPKLGQAITAKLKDLKVEHEPAIALEVFRGIRAHLPSLLSGIPASDLKNMTLGLSHSLSRYKLKFSPDKVDTMIIQAIALLDDLDKELNTYSMRCKEWYGWHFPELARIVVDNVAFARTVKLMGVRTNASKVDLEAVLPEELVEEVRQAAEISMGTEISQEDQSNIVHLCDQIISISEYRAQLYDYLRHRMLAIAPNLTAVVGELVGARLISHAGSLLQLAKQPASTVQILGAEKALFRALKTKHDTPKYGLIYHASLIGQAGPKLKGKVARMVATKASLGARVDALGEGDSIEATVGIEGRQKVEARLRHLEGTLLSQSSRKKGDYGAKQKRYEAPVNGVKTYNPASDFTKPSKKEMKEETLEKSDEKKRKKRDVDEDDKKEKKRKKRKEEDSSDVDVKKEKKEKEKKEKKEKKKEKSEDGEKTKKTKREKS